MGRRRMQRRAKYETLLQLIRDSTLTLKKIRKEHPEISSGTFHSTMNTLSKHNLVKKIPLGKRRIAYQRTSKYTLEKGRAILKTHFQEKAKEFGEVIRPKPLQINEEFPASKFGKVVNASVIPRAHRGQRRRNYSWCDAAYQTLKAENTPLGPTALAEKILSAQLIKSKSRNPANTVYTCIFQDMKSKGTRSRFMKFGRKIGLVEWADRLGDYVQSELQVATQTRFWERFKFKEIPTKKLLSSIRGEIREIRAFLKGDPTVEPSQEKLCFWVWFCYQFGLYWEGALVFRRINTLKVSPPLYQIIKRMGVICENRRE